jgi:hypothetical protein
LSKRVGQLVQSSAEGGRYCLALVCWWSDRRGTAPRLLWAGAATVPYDGASPASGAPGLSEAGSECFER